MYGVLYPYVKAISLAERIHMKPIMSVRNNTQISLGIIKGLLYLGSKDIYHLNLKASNILVRLFQFKSVL